MKHLKLVLLIIVAICTFGTAEAQSVVLRVGNGPHHPPRGRYVHGGRHYAHRTPYYRNHHRYYRYH